MYLTGKNDICLYIGQSKNISSRIATHLSGKYKECTSILIYESFSEIDFCLNETERFFMKKFLPTENINIDFSYEINDDLIMESTARYKKDYCEKNNEVFNIKDEFNFFIINGIDDLFIMDDLLHFNLKAIKNISSLLHNLSGDK